MKKLLLLIISLAVQYSGYSQSLSPFIISSSGNFSSGGGYSLSSTTGEMTMINTFSQASTILTQGFQQPHDIFTGIQNPAFMDFSLIWYPNPSSGLINVTINSKYSGNILFRITDNIGKLVWLSEKRMETGFNQQEFSLDILAEGLYHVETLFTADGGNNYSRNINIISIIH